MRSWSFVVLAACSTTEAPPVDVTGFDVVVSSTSLEVWVGLTGALAYSGHFPAPGACGGFSDNAPITQNCFGSLDVDGVAISSRNNLGPVNPFGMQLTVTPTSILTATDCGRTIEIPLHAGPYPVASNLAATRAGADLLVSWASDAPFALAVIGGTFGDLECLDTNTGEHRFPMESGDSYAFVQAFASPEITETELGEVRVWYGDRANLPGPPP
jgi:hypothetical protein